MPTSARWAWPSSCRARAQSSIPRPSSRVPRAGAKLDPEAVIARLRDTLAHFKVPRRCFIASELPRNSMGKVQKNLLREQYRGLFLKV